AFTGDATKSFALLLGNADYTGRNGHPGPGLPPPSVLRASARDAQLGRSRRCRALGAPMSPLAAVSSSAVARGGGALGRHTIGRFGDAQLHRAALAVADDLELDRPAHFRVRREPL